jgi:acyl-coenzyme A synthetase/AMP-(fatty) acid ligase
MVLEVHRFAAFLSENGVKCKDFVGVLMTNSPEMVIAVLSLSKLGAVAALININLRGIVKVSPVSVIGTY